MNFDALIGSIELGNTEVLIASISPTKEREESVSFSTPYYEGHQSIISLNQESLDSLNTLNNKNVAVMEGSISDFIVSGESDEYPEIRASGIKRFKRATDALQELKNGSVDAVLIDSIIATRLVADNEDLEIMVIESTAEPAVICVKKGSEELLQSINTALDEMKADGTYNRIYENYFIKEVVFE
jgi:polar amino acid transport system substrate-binding protein